MGAGADFGTGAPPGSRQGRPRRTISALTVALLLDGLAVALFMATQVLVAQHMPRSGNTVEAGRGFFADPLPAFSLLAAASSAVAGGVVAAASIYTDRFATPRGRWAVRLGILNFLITPLMGTVAGLFSVAGHPLPIGWGEPFVPFWVVSGFGAVVLGLTAGEPKHRGALLLPAVFGGAVLTFWLGEILAPH